jgi:hypothetical protein
MVELPLPLLLLRRRRRHHHHHLLLLLLCSDVFERSKTQDGAFEFTIATPPGRDGIEIAGISLGYPVLKADGAAD